MNRGLKKGIRGQLVLPSSDQMLKNINENIEVFKAVCDRDFEYCAFDIYEGTFDNTECIGIDFEILDRTVQESNASYSRFKNEIYNHFGAKPTQVFVGKYDKI